jgi:hypothetical protein
MVAGQRFVRGRHQLRRHGAPPEAAPAAPRPINEDTPAALNEIIMTALAKDPEMRFASAAVLSVLQPFQTVCASPIEA